MLNMPMPTPTPVSSAEVDAALAQLKDIHLPEAVSAWPPAPGYYIVGLLLLITLLFIGWFIIRTKKNRWRKIFIRQLENAAEMFSANRDYPRLTENLNVLLKTTLASRTLMVPVPEGKLSATALSGDDWVKHLIIVCPELVEELEHLKPLRCASYQHKVNYDADALIDAVRKWGKLCP